MTTIPHPATIVPLDALRMEAKAVVRAQVIAWKVAGVRSDVVRKTLAGKFTCCMGWGEIEQYLVDWYIARRARGIMESKRAQAIDASPRSTGPCIERPDRPTQGDGKIVRMKTMKRAA